MGWDTLTSTIHKAAGSVLDDMPEDVRVGIPKTGGYYINADHLEPLTVHLQLFIAHVIAGLIDAGSERDAVMENGVLETAIHDELKGWSNRP
jgi:hypothetical protein